MSSAGKGREAGQATVELVALLPLALAAGLAILQLLAAGAARELAGHAAEAAAIAHGAHGDPRVAARAAVPGWAAADVGVSVRGTRVEVWLRPRSPVRALADLLTASATADAGPGG